MNPISASLGPSERLLLLGLSRETLRRTAAGEDPPQVPGCRVPPALQATLGCFVTLTQAGALRGCIGNVEPAGALWQAVIDNTRAAALRDTRFPPVQPAEVPSIRIELSLLSTPELLARPTPDDLVAALRPGHDGVLLEVGSRRATFLPQVWAKMPDRVKFMNQLAVKAGLSPTAWQRPDAIVRTYQAEHFSEEQEGLAPAGTEPA